MKRLLKRLRWLVMHKLVGRVRTVRTSADMVNALQRRKKYDVIDVLSDEIPSLPRNLRRAGERRLEKQRRHVH